MSIANTPKPPYYAVIFTSLHTHKEKEEYDKASARMVELAQNMPGYLGVESVRDPNGFGITSVYWKDKESIKAWRNHTEHKKVKKRGRVIWYEKYIVRIAKVEKDYGKI
ncbi:MAG: antibiotic biosynthesis monooxygenase [Candidatus Marinimicrobia bacterium]|nr:antibiotic biosynthesis monooxygenase [Candidatus Neomarinimicrobiota bacterium]MBL7009590.1 antibiotic biosynthesis monooxygenase [Candidatus Neomarinimicrobiota bacterium]MBL7029667.1 antibiotic biosynthesis monooxygenase [Candidatus Neomarinimicrobiota bacterium]